ncbi:MAG: hypothetical protein OHK0048_07030 [Rhodoferax sp.]
MTAGRLSAKDRPWKDWVLDQIQVGLLVLDEKTQVVFANPWFLQHAGLEADAVVGRDLFAVFPQLKGQYFETLMQQVLRSGFAAMMSQSLHPTPFPLYVDRGQRDQDKLLRQSVRIVPMSRTTANSLGQRYVLIQITDVTTAIARERLLKAQAIKLQSMAHLDVLTNLGNRRHLDETLTNALKAARRARTPVGVVLFDIDYFKQYNDHYGHLAGDACLRRVADVLRAVCKRPHDSVARFGGEELVAVLPDTDEAGAARVAEQVLQAVRDLQIAHAHSSAANVLTVSAGVSACVPTQPVDAQTLLQQADIALYQAKAQGRNRWIPFSATRFVKAEASGC